MKHTQTRLRKRASWWRTQSNKHPLVNQSVAESLDEVANALRPAEMTAARRRKLTDLVKALVGAKPRRK